MNNSDNNVGKEGPEEKRPKLWGAIYMLLGVIGLAFSAYELLNSIGMVPLYGTVTTASLAGVLSILIIIYGYRVMNRDY
ncbi:MAG TPA: hypothetical protein VK806_09170 [Bacteroidia bacterium]|jgi:hypothetical protein|nr:hypothetical protein [Bacteroidia bacterium]